MWRVSRVWGERRKSARHAGPGCVACFCGFGFEEGGALEPLVHRVRVLPEQHGGQQLGPAVGATGVTGWVYTWGVCLRGGCEQVGVNRLVWTGWVFVVGVNQVGVSRRGRGR